MTFFCSFFHSLSRYHSTHVACGFYSAFLQLRLTFFASILPHIVFPTLSSCGSSHTLEERWRQGYLCKHGEEISKRKKEVLSNERRAHSALHVPISD
uniref:Uncharacterized protein n=1 Tax=Physcomitrium patens TaxID=3218 RepID=A0A2K1JDJ9_PHYPA|nr:hypothetical protein PHYPA_019883 [Physcomitrium patens]